MLILIILAGSALGIFIMLYLGRYIYFKYHPERTLENILNPSLNAISASNGLDGQDGAHGILNSLALSGLKGLPGEAGTRGKSGNKNFNTGLAGIRGKVGLTGPYGSIGLTGEHGLPSNSIISYIERADSKVKNIPYRVEHGFTVDGVFYKLSAFFLFDELTYFSFHNGIKNTKYKIRDSDLDVIGANGLRAKKIYTSLRIVIEKKNGKSDGIITDISPPISRESYLLRYNTNDFNDFSYIEEKEIEKNKEFGLDFDIVPNNDTNSFINFLLFGFANYLCIFDIEPPNPNLIPRIEERYSKNPITFLDIPSFHVEAKGNVRKITKEVPPPHTITPVPLESIYLLSPRLNTGKVVRKNSSNNKNLWVVENINRIQEAIDNLDLSKITQAFSLLEEDNITFKDDLKRSKKELLLRAYSATSSIQDNVRIIGPNTNLNSVNTFLFTRATFNDFFIYYPNNNSRLSYPSSLHNSRIYIEFIAKINLEKIEKIKYKIYYDDGGIPKNEVLENDNNFKLISNLSTIAPINTANNYLDSNYENNYVKYKVRLLNSSLDFQKFYGRKAIIDFSKSKTIIEGFFSSINNFNNHINNTSVDTNVDIIMQGGDLVNLSRNDRFADQFPYNINYGLVSVPVNVDFTAETSDIEIDNNVILVGLTNPNLPTNITRYQRIHVTKISNNKYLFDIPTTGFEFF